MHPDLGGENGRAQELNEAHEVLSDPEKRRAYDRSVLKPESGPDRAGAYPGGVRSKSAARGIIAGAALLLAIAAAVLYFSREKEPVWIGGGIALSGGGAGAAKR